MICKNCGRILGDGYSFCPFCGNKLVYEKESTPFVYEEPLKTTSSLAENIRKLLKGPLMIILIIFIAIMTVLSLVMYTESICSSKMLLPSILGFVVIMLPMTLNFCGLIVIRGSAASGMNVGGFGAVKAANVICIVLLSIITTIVSCFFLAVQMDIAYVHNVDIIVIFIYITFTVLTFICLAKNINALNVLRDIVNGREIYESPSLFIVVYNIIMFFLNIFIFAAFFLTTLHAQLVLFNFLNIINSSVLYIVSSIMVIKARNIIETERKNMIMKKRIESERKSYIATSVIEKLRNVSSVNPSKDYFRPANSQYDDPLR